MVVSVPVVVVVPLTPFSREVVEVMVDVVDPMPEVDVVEPVPWPLPEVDMVEVVP